MASAGRGDSVARSDDGGAMTALSTAPTLRVPGTLAVAVAEMGTGTSPLLRFLAKIRMPEDGCWEWTASRHPRMGYGRFGDGHRRIVYAHRYMWELARGPIPHGMNVLHRCDNGPCVRPSHLFLGTQRDNIADVIAKGRPLGPRPQEHCHAGHPLSGDNLYYPPKGKRHCRACRAERQRRKTEAARLRRSTGQGRGGL